MEKASVVTETKPVVSEELTLEQLEERLNDARRAQALAEDRRLARSRDSAKRSEIDKLTQEAYQQARTAHGVEFLREDIDKATTDEDKNLLVLTYLMQEQQRLDSEIKNPTNQSRIEKLRRLGRSALGAAGNWLTRGSKKTQFAKSMLVTAAASTAFGVLGGGVAAAGGMAAIRYAKGYATGKTRKVNRHSNFDKLRYDMDSDFENVHSSFLKAQVLMQAEREQGIIDTQKRNREAHKQAMGAVVVGAVVGTTLGSLIHYDEFPVYASAQADDTIVPPTLEPTAETVVPDLASEDLLDTFAVENDTTSVEMTEDDMLLAYGIDDSLFNPALGVEPDEIEVATSVENPEVELGTPELTESDDSLIANPVDDEFYNPDLVDEDGLLSANSVEADLYHPELTEDEVALPAHPVDGEVANPEVKNEIGAFTVECGNGYTHELIDAAKANGVDLTPTEAWEAHQTIVDRVGTDYIDLVDHVGDDTYSMGDSSYETGISAPGEATWSTEAEPLIADLIDDGEINDSVDTTNVDTVNADVDNATDTETAHEVTVAELETGTEPNAESSIEISESDQAASEATEIEDELGNNDDATAVESGLSVEDWSEIENMLEQAADRDQLNTLSAYGRELMYDLGPMLRDIVYEDGTGIVSVNGRGDWTFNDSESPLPQKALDTIYRYLDANDAARDRVQDALRVL